MPRQIRTIVTQVGSFLLAGLLLFLALRGVDFSEVWTALREAEYAWLIPLTAVVLVSHWIRAWRWQMLLDALPGIDRRIPMRDAFAAIMIGYMVNYAAPRLGEFVRTGNLASRQRIGFSGVFGTVVVERFLDVAVLVVGLGSVLVLLRGRMGDVHRVFVEPLGDGLTIPLALILTLGVLTVGVLVASIGRSYLHRSERAARFWATRVRPAVASFKTGFLTLFRSRRRVRLITSTVLIWLCYTLMAHVPFIMLGMADRYGLTLADSWTIMIIGALGVVIPSPGGTGSYHYVTVVVLTTFFAFDRAPAATYAVLTHAAQLVLYVIVGFTCIIIQGATLRSIRTDAASRDTGSEELRPRGTDHGS